MEAAAWLAARILPSAEALRMPIGEWRNRSRYGQLGSCGCSTPRREALRGVTVRPEASSLVPGESMVSERLAPVPGAGPPLWDSTAGTGDFTHHGRPGLPPADPIA